MGLDLGGEEWIKHPLSFSVSNKEFFNFWTSGHSLRIASFALAFTPRFAFKTSATHFNFGRVLTRGFVTDFGVIFVYISARVFDYDIIGYTFVNISARGWLRHQLCHNRHHLHHQLEWGGSPSTTSVTSTMPTSFTSSMQKNFSQAPAKRG
jgi:hypothetical protein